MSANADGRGDHMEKRHVKSLYLIVSVIISCVVMAVIETVIEPAYFVKSALKIVFFLILPVIILKTQKEKVFSASFILDKKSLLGLSALGVVIYAIIMAAFALTRGIFDYASLVDSLSSDQNVSQNSFVPVALYISFCNSLLEEFLFRFVAFIKLSEYTTKKTAYIFSSVAFSLYHVAMIGASFPMPLLLLSVVGLAFGGAIFNYVDDRGGNIYNSWFIHMFADFAIMTIWYIHIQ